MKKIETTEINYNFHENGDLVAPDDVAESLFNLMTKHSMDDSGNRFDVREL